jgi:DNA topoisomerase-1
VREAVSAAPRGLVYVTDAAPGIRRIKAGGSFRYVGPDGKPIRDAGELDRIRKLAIPPAYEDVWICPKANGHLQATGRDVRGRKQYRYHGLWREARDADKFVRMLGFGAALPKIRRVVAAELGKPVPAKPTREAVLAAIVRLLDTTLVRIGNDEYARSNKSYGLTTLRTRHAAVRGAVLELHFVGKSGKEHAVGLDDPRVARIVRRCQEMPGQELFQYADADGTRHKVGSDDVNAFLREVTGDDFTAKDFRTWHGTVHALDLWVESCSADASCRATAKALLGEVASKLGNTVAVCKKSYVHPRVLDAISGPADAALVAGIVVKPKPGLTAAERRLLGFLAVETQLSTPLRASVGRQTKRNESKRAGQGVDGALQAA